MGTNTKVGAYYYSPATPETESFNILHDERHPVHTTKADSSTMFDYGAKEFLQAKVTNLPNWKRGSVFSYFASQYLHLESVRKDRSL